MPVALCASCKSRVEEGAVRCPSCNARLFKPGAFMQVVGWVVAAVSTIPFAVSEVTTSERDWTPLILGCVVLAAGIVLVIVGRGRSRAAPPSIIEEATPAAPAPQA